MNLEKFKGPNHIRFRHYLLDNYKLTDQFNRELVQEFSEKFNIHHTIITAIIGLERKAQGIVVRNKKENQKVVKYLIDNVDLSTRLDFGTTSELAKKFNLPIQSIRHCVQMARSHSKTKPTKSKTQTIKKAILKELDISQPIHHGELTKLANKLRKSGVDIEEHRIKNVIFRLRQEQGVKTPDKNRMEELSKESIRLREEGMSWRAIGKQLGMDGVTLTQYVSRYKRKLRQQEKRNASI